MMRSTLAGVVVLLLAAVGAGPAGPLPAERRLETEIAAADLSAMEEKVGERINAVRREHGLQPLAPDPALARLAREYSRRMAEENFFSHTAPGGDTLTDRLQAAGIPYRLAGENIFKSYNVADPVEPAVEGWMQSPGHRANILEPGFTRTGIGIWREGRTFFFTQAFLRPPP